MKMLAFAVGAALALAHAAAAVSAPQNFVIGLPSTLLMDGEGREIGPAEWDAPEMVAFLRSFLSATEKGEGS